ncbi:MAG: DUF4249 domain-containing protein [Bacteroidota bacterium]
MKKIPFYLLLLCISFVACEKEIPFRSEVQEPKLVINSLFNADSTWAVNVSRSLDVLNPDDLQTVNDAVVRITDEASGDVIPLSFRGNGIYAADSAQPSANRSYRIDVAAPGYADVSARDAIPGAIQIVSVETTLVEVDVNVYELEVEVTFADPPGVPNYYMIDVRAFVTYEFNPGQEETFDYSVNLASTDPNLETEGRFDDIYDYILLQDQAFDGQNYTLKFAVQDYFPPGVSEQLVYRLSIVSSSQAFFDYRRTYLLYQESRDNPFAQPVQVFTNVENGFGIFAGGTRTSQDI